MAAAVSLADALKIEVPAEPTSIEESGLPFSFICDLVLKVLYFHGGMQGRELSDHVCLPFAFVEAALKFLADEGYTSSAGLRVKNLSDEKSIAEGMQYVISGTGRQRAREVLELNQYAGPAPVPFEAYAKTAEKQAAALSTLNRARLHDVLSHLVLSPEVVDSLGPALSAREAIFLYGPPGNGKTTIAEASVAILGAPLFVPHALYVHGEVIRFFDPVHHIPVKRDLPPYDRRWQLTERPVVTTGGELAPHMLELSFDKTMGFYEAPLQLKANGGLFLIDDFGRQQRLSPRELLNRLIVPLEKSVDYLNIARAGTSVGVPFTCLLMLSTNLEPRQLMDEAFLRRVRFKVFVPNPTEEQYREIWRRQCASACVDFDEEVINTLIERHYRSKGRVFHGVHPRDLLSHAVHIARYLDWPAKLTEALMERACETYFVEPDGPGQ